MIEMALRAVLIGDAGVAALIAGRCYPVEPPQAPVYPYVTYQEITDEGHYHMEGSSRLSRARFQINCDAESALDAQALKRAVRDALGGFSGPVTISELSPPAVVTIQGAFLVMGLDEPQGELQRTGLRTLRKSVDFNIWFEE